MNDTPGTRTELKERMSPPHESLKTVVNFFALGVIVGQVDVKDFDRVINALIQATNGELQDELFRIKTFTKRVLTHAQ